MTQTIRAFFKGSGQKIMLTSAASAWLAMTSGLASPASLLADDGKVVIKLQLTSSTPSSSEAANEKASNKNTASRRLTDDAGIWVVPHDLVLSGKTLPLKRNQAAKPGIPELPLVAMLAYGSSEAVPPSEQGVGPELDMRLQTAELGQSSLDSDPVSLSSPLVHGDNAGSKGIASQSPTSGQGPDAESVEMVFQGADEGKTPATDEPDAAYSKIALNDRTQSQRKTSALTKLDANQVGDSNVVSPYAAPTKGTKASDASSAASDASEAVDSEGNATELTELEREIRSFRAGGPEATESDQKAGAECPGAPSGSLASQELQPDDLPLEESEHPYEAPATRMQKTATTVEPPPKAPAAATFTAREQSIELGIDRCLQYFIDHPENITRRGPWALMHTALPFGVESEIIAGNRRVNTIGWMCYNGVCAKQRMFQPTRQGFRTNVGPGVQGHEGQFLAILAQSKVQADYPIQIGRSSYSISDLVRYEMATCRERSELTFKLIGLSHYLQPEQRWRDNRGQYWNLEKMVAEELAQPVIGAACGGTHRLMGLTYALLKRQEAGLPITGHWKRAETFLNDFVNYALSLQNPDGSFSTEWFEGRGNDQDLDRKFQTTGHIVEWLIYTLPDEHLRSPQIQAAVEYLLRTVGANPSRDWAIGPRGHALRALVLYKQRVFGAEAGQIVEQLAAGPVSRR